MNRYLIALALIAVVCIGGYGAWWAVTQERTPAGPPGQITVGLEPNQVNSLIYIADEKGYFAESGLNVTLKEYPSGAAAVDGMLGGEADVAMATEWVLAGQALTQDHVRTFACVDKFQQVSILGRNDRGIRNASDLRGKTIGLPLKTSPEFYLGRFLNLHGIGVGDVTIVDVKAPQLAVALANGTVDAVVAWQPYTARVTDGVTTGLAVWPAESGQAAYCAAITTDVWLAEQQKPSQRFLHALERAETDVARDPAAAKATIGKRLNYDSAYIDTVWPEHRFALSLDQSLIAAMEDEARWKIANNLTNATAVPDFTKYVSTAGLAAVDSDAVKIIPGRSGP